ncbi:MAG TPA: UPF0179 family protein [Candidatus Thermoplasmatota archaeon]|nr:UPF0179 family protein [Candidatus Thermoplasmatota archaeon]
MAKIVTIIGSKLATPGTSFVYEGVVPECEGCKLKKVCHHGMEVHHPYEVTGVREVEHDCCTVFEGTVKVVEVEARLPRITIPVTALRGTGYTRHWEECGEACAYKAYCNPAAVPEGTTVALKEIQEDVVCKAGRHLKWALVEKAKVKG